MGLMDREYMHRTPEEREAEYRKRRSPQQVSEDQKHKERQLEMYRLMAKGNNLSSSERKRLDRIYEENRAYITRSETRSNYQPDSYKGKTISSTSKKKKSSFVPVIIFTIVIICLILIFSFYPELVDFDIWEFIGHYGPVIRSFLLSNLGLR